LKELIKYFKKFYIPFFIAVVAVSVEASCDLLIPAFTAKIIDEGIKQLRQDLIIKYSVIMICITLLSICLAMIRNYISANVSQKFGGVLRLEIFKKIHKLSVEEVDKIGSDTLLTRLTSDVIQVQNFILGLMRVFVRAPVLCIGSVTMAIIINPKISIILFIAIPLVFCLMGISMVLSFPRYMKVQQAVDKINLVMREYLEGIRLVKAFNRFSSEKKKFEDKNELLTDKSIKANRVNVLFSPFTALTINICVIFVLWIGGRYVNSGNMKVGQIVAFLSYMTQIIFSLNMIYNVFNIFVRARASANRISSVLKAPEEKEPSEEKSLSKENTGISFKNVTFCYPRGSNVPVIDSLDFGCDKGEILAVIGPTGSGKSTIASLIMRYYKAQGEIYVCGQNINSIKNETLRSDVSIVPQKSVLFSGTIMDNLRFGCETATDDEIITASKIACADSFIKMLENGYYTVLGQGGVNLSGGQKQRISIARAILRNPKLLILDDCTSALDGVTEAKVLNELKIKSNENNMTVILITQKIGTAMKADQILVLENGKKVSQGEHKELLKNCRLYLEIYNSQIGIA
jgi:ATP-binding cassette, subfamily B, multidrug efflux pump